MNLIYQNGLFAINECKVTKIDSIKSGNKINIIEGRLRIGENNNPQDFSSIKIVDIVDEENDKKISCALQVHSTYHTDSSAYWDINISCVEVEEYVVDELEINDISIKPYEYEEEVVGNALIITLKTEVDENVFEQIKSVYFAPYFNQKSADVISYFNVKRHGLSDKKMRLGQPIWSENSGVYKLQLTIVESVYDTENDSKMPNEPGLSNMKDMIANLNVMSKKIVKILVDKKIIDEIEAKDLLLSNDKEVSNELFKMKKVNNIDTYSKC